MTRLELSNGLVVEAIDSLSWQVRQTKIPTGPKAKHAETTVILGYYSTLAGALDRAADMVLRESDATTLEEVLAALRAFRAELFSLTSLEASGE